MVDLFVHLIGSVCCACFVRLLRIPSHKRAPLHKCICDIHRIHRLVASCKISIAVRAVLCMESHHNLSSAWVVKNSAKEISTCHVLAREQKTCVIVLTLSGSCRQDASHRRAIARRICPAVHSFPVHFITHWPPFCGRQLILLPRSPCSGMQFASL